MISAREVADYFLAGVDEEAGEILTNLKIQKLLYYAQGFHLAMYDEPLFGEEIFAWLHGPVIPTLYREFARYKPGMIPISDSFSFLVYPKRVRELLDEVREVFGQYESSRLEKMVYAEPPYMQTDNGEKIDGGSMRDFFGTLLVADDGKQGGSSMSCHDTLTVWTIWYVVFPAFLILELSHVLAWSFFLVSNFLSRCSRAVVRFVRTPSRGDNYA